MGNNSQIVTRKDLQKDLKNLEYNIVDQISSVFTDAMTTIGISFQRLETRFDGLENRFDGQDSRFQRLETRFDELETEAVDIKTAVNRIEQKLDPTIEIVGQLSIDVAMLKAKTA